jgi:hypothetical protein
LLDKLLAKDAAHRLANAREVVEAIEDAPQAAQPLEQPAAPEQAAQPALAS